ncbi:MAG: hypothetical protein ACRCUE_19500 [Bosea sp. (in: a-proteobacteria)]
MLYRAGGNVLLESGAYSTRIVADHDELSAALADGWFLGQYAAKDASEMQAPATDPSATAEPARTKRPHNRKAAA